MSATCPFNQDSLEKLKGFIDLITRDPQLIHYPQLDFFKQYLIKLGANIPSPSTSPKMETGTPPPHKEQKSEDVKEEASESDTESELEFDMEGCIDADKVDEEKQVMGSPNVEVSEEDCDKADNKRVEAMSFLSEGNFEKSIELLSEAITLNPNSAVLFVKRGQSYLKLNKPNACIKDCTHALELNPDSATAFKFRGRAHRLLGNWEEAANDLRQAGKIDFDEQIDEWLKEVTPNAQKIVQHKLKQERKKAEKEVKERSERLRRAKEAQAKAAAAANAGANDADDGFGDFNAENAGAGLGGMGGMGGMSDIYKLFQDPEVMTAFKDPEVAAAFQDISVNPANFTKYQSNPKVMNVLTKLSSKMGGEKNFPGFPGGMGGGSPGGMGGFPGMGGFGGPNPTPGKDEDGLD